VFATSVIEISRSALRNNIRFLSEMLGPNAGFSSVIKGNAYGHGIATFVPLAERCGVRHFSVFGADEALAAQRALCCDSEIMIMGAIDDDELAWAIEHGVSFYVFEMGRLESALATARAVGRPARIHLELETGLNRTGFRADEIERPAGLIRDNREQFALEGVCTHYAGAESEGNYLRIQRQIQTFHDLVGALARLGLRFRVRHTACSAAAFTYPETIMELARIGIAQYGYWSSRETQMRYFLARKQTADERVPDPLRRVIKWKSRVMAVQPVPEGEFVGYGASRLTTKPGRLAAVPVGYFHGFSRAMSNLGHVLIRGRRAPVAGVVNMNMMMVDVSDIPGVEKGDQVVLIGKQRKAEITVGFFGDMTRDMTYEVLVRLPSEIPRVTVD
jgi:alanine racemase